MKYAIVIEKTRTSYSAYVPDVPGCVTVGKTRREIIKNMHEALDLYMEVIAEDGRRAPKPTSSTAYVDVATPRARPVAVRRGGGVPLSLRGAATRYVRRRNGAATHSHKRP